MSKYLEFSAWFIVRAQKNVTSTKVVYNIQKEDAVSCPKGKPDRGYN